MGERTSGEPREGRFLVGGRTIEEYLDFLRVKQAADERDEEAPGPEKAED